MLQHLTRRVCRSAVKDIKTVKLGVNSHVTFNLTGTHRLWSTMASEPYPVQITSVPAAGQLVNHDGKVFKTVKEGSAYILVPPNAQTSVDPLQARLQNPAEMQSVFYNPIQQFNRDLSVLAIKAFGEDRCQKKFLGHDRINEKKLRKQERKRKRKETEENDGGEVDGGVKVRRLGDGSYAADDNTASASGTAGLNLNGAGTATATTNGTDTQQQSSTTSKGKARVTDATEQPADRESEGSGVNVGVEPDKNELPNWQPRFRILDALSASGLRALRYASEISFVTEVVANDRDKKAVQAIKMNVQHNNLSSSIKPTTGDALGHMYSIAYPSPNSHGPAHISGKYDVVDLDPYGTAAPFIDAALQALEDGGMLCVTSTDSGVFASCGYSEKTFALYGGMPIKGLHSHEGGLRLLLHAVATSASRHGLAIEPLLSLSLDFYARLFIRVRKSPADVKFLAGKTMVVYDCDHGCGAWTLQPLGRHNKYKNSDTNWRYTIAQAPASNQHCEHCGSKTHLAGPMWGGPLHNPVFLEKTLQDLKFADPEIYQTKPRIEGMLDTALDELIVFSDTMSLREGPLPTQPNGKGKAKASTEAEEKQTQTQTRDLIPRTPPETIDHHPFFFIPSALCKVIHAVAPSDTQVKGALRHAGYKATRSHCRPGSIKTDAPWSAIWEIMREWVRQKKPVKEGAVKEGTPGARILGGMRKAEQTEGNGGGEGETAAGAEEGEVDEGAATPDVVTEAMDELDGLEAEKPKDVKRMVVVFDEKLGKDKPGRRLVRYQENPKENWGPMRKAKGTA